MRKRHHPRAGIPLLLSVLITVLSVGVGILGTQASSATKDPLATGLELPWGTVPLDAECPVQPSGAVEAPRDWDHACRFTGPRGGQILVGHSIRGPREPLMEKIPQLQVGETVRVDGQVFTVASVERHRLAELPASLWDGGNLALVTCDVAKLRGNITHNWVVVLQPTLA